MKRINDQYITEEGKTANDQNCVSLFKTHGKWEDGELFKLSHKEYIRAWYDTAPTEAEILHEIELNDWTRWNKELPEGQKVEISEAAYWDLLECLPPHKQMGNYFECGEPHHHTNKGNAIHRACWSEDGKWYTGYPRIADKTIEIHEHNTIEQGYYKVWFDYNGKTEQRLCSEALVNSFLNMRQKEDFFMGVYRFKILDYDFMELVNSKPEDKLRYKHEIIINSLPDRP